MGNPTEKLEPYNILTAFGVDVGLKQKHGTVPAGVTGPIEVHYSKYDKSIYIHYFDLAKESAVEPVLEELGVRLKAALPERVVKGIRMGVAGGNLCVAMSPATYYEISGRKLDCETTRVLP